MSKGPSDANDLHLEGRSGVSNPGPASPSERDKRHPVQCVAKRVQVALGSGSGGNNASAPQHGPKRARAPQQHIFLNKKTLRCMTNSLNIIPIRVANEGAV